MLGFVGGGRERDRERGLGEGAVAFVWRPVDLVHEHLEENCTSERKQQVGRPWDSV